MAGKMSGSPYHVETAQYKYATEQSEDPVAKSEFNQTITRCSHCAYCCDHNRLLICTNLNVPKQGDRHCTGFLNSKDVSNLTEFKNSALAKYYCYHNHIMIRTLISKLKWYRPGDSKLIDSYYGKRWLVAGIDKAYDKADLAHLFQTLKGQYWSNKVPWDYIDCDIVIDMRSQNAKMKDIKKRIGQGYYADRELPRIIMIQQFRADIVRMIKSFSVK